MRKITTFWIGGFHSVIAAIQNKSRKVKQVITTEYIAQLDKEQIKYKVVDKKIIKKIFRYSEFQTQNIAAEIEHLPKLELENEIKKSEYKNIIILDGINDPRNIGSIVRTSVAFNINAIILKEKDYNSTSASMYKTASGGMEFIKIFDMTNLTQAINLLKKNDYWIYGLDHKAVHSFDAKKLSQKNAFIFGAEGSGITKNIKEKCDYLIKLNTNQQMGSLNVSNAVSATLSLVNLNSF